MTIHEQIIAAFRRKHYLTSKDLVDIAGFRYSARLHELRKKGFEFIWDFKKDLKGNKTHTTIYVMR